MEDFERLLAQKEKVFTNNFNRRVEKIETADIKTEDDTSRQKSDKGCTLFEFITMVDALIKLTIDNVDFIPDERKIHSMDIMKNMDKPIISYKVIERKPKKEIKPRIREDFEEINPYTKEKLLGQVHGQKFTAIVQFDIVGSVYTEAEEVMNMFEELMLKYTGFYKKNGVAELIFEEHLSDSSFDNLRESFSIRSLRYYVEIEKLTVSFKQEIEEIELLAQKVINKEE